MTTETSEKVATWRKVVAGVLFAIPWIFYLLLPLYNTAQPELGGVPFFYWFQTLWLVVSSILFIIAVFILYPGRR
jgi:sterol desaturase/sphingolipid hydroxylase (fatty acid hydroxylase superfamily)